MAFVPIALAAIPAIMSLISGGIGAASAIKGLQGKGIRRAIHRRKRGGAIKHYKKHYVHKRRVHRRGKGVVSDFLGNIPLLGGILGPIARAFGGRLNRRHKGGRHGMPHMRGSHILKAILAGGNGLSPMCIQRPYAGGRLKRHTKRGHGLSPMYIQRPYAGGSLMAMRPLWKRMLTPTRGRPGRGLLAPAGSHLAPLLKALVMPNTAHLQRPYSAHVWPQQLPAIAGIPNSASVQLKGMGFLTPTGGRLVHRKGYYRKVHGHRVHVAPTTVHVGRGMMRRRVHHKKAGARKRGGAAVHHRKGHYRYVHGKRVHVKGGKVHRRKGGYIPYTWRGPY